MNTNRLRWHVGFTVGVRSVDEGHAELVRLYNGIVEACEEGVLIPSVRERVRTFLLYARWHFGEEECCMRSVQYPRYLEHKAIHDRLLQDARDFIENLAGPLSGDDAIAVVKYFRFWLSRHMSSQDRELKVFLSGNDGEGVTVTSLGKP